MKIRLTLVGSAHGASHVFGEEGGLFGRSRKCDWVLPDEERILSSVHGRVVYHGGRFSLVDESTNGIVLEGASEPIGRGRSVPLDNGVRFTAGRYVIAAQLVGTQEPVPPAAPHPFDVPAAPAPPFGGGLPGAGGPQPSPFGNEPGAYGMGPGGAAPPANQDPLQLLGAQAGGGAGARVEPPLGIPPSQAPAPGGSTPGPLTALRNGYDPAGSARSADPFAPQAGAASPLGPTPNIPPPMAASPPLPPGNPMIPAGGFQEPATPPALPAAMPTSPPPVPPVPVMPASPVAAPPVASPVTQIPVQGHGLKPPEPPSQIPGQPAAPTPPVPHAAPPVTPPQSPQGGSPGGIPEDFLSKLGPIGRRNDGPEPPMAANPASPQAVNPAPAVQTGAPQPVQTTIPDGFDFLTRGNAASPVLPSAPAADPGAVPSEPPLSPSLRADEVELAPPSRGEPVSEKTPFDTLEALKSRRQQRKAALREKANSASRSDGALSAPWSTPAPATPPPMPTQGSAPPSPPPLPPHGAAPMASPQSPAPPPPPVPAPAMTGAASADADTAFVQALLAGMGFPDATVEPERREQFAHEIGGMVRELANGLVVLLSARKMVKSEFRLDETQVQPEENNPFKFFKLAELALDEILLTRKGGFQEPEEATRAAFFDIQQHTMVTMSAMQRAIKLLFERLGPDAIGQDEEGGLRIRGLGKGKGKWDTYVEAHSRMTGNMDALSRQIIAEAFAQVQEEQARKVSEEYWSNKK